MISQRATVARPYAVALFEQAKATDMVAPVQSLLDSLCALYAMEEVKNLLHHQSISNDMKLDICLSLLDCQDNWQRQIVALFVTGNRIAAIAEVQDAYKQIVHDNENTIEVVLYSAHPLSNNNQQLLEKALSYYTDGKRALIRCAQNPALVGGFEARIGDKVISGSVKDLLRRIVA